MEIEKNKQKHFQYLAKNLLDLNIWAEEIECDIPFYFKYLSDGRSVFQEIYFGKY